MLLSRRPDYAADVHEYYILLPYSRRKLTWQYEWIQASGQPTGNLQKAHSSELTMLHKSSRLNGKTWCTPSHQLSPFTKYTITSWRMMMFYIIYPWVPRTSRNVSRPGPRDDKSALFFEFKWGQSADGPAGGLWQWCNFYDSEVGWHIWISTVSTQQRQQSDCSAVGVSAAVYY